MVDSRLGWRLVDLQMLSIHAAFHPCPLALGLHQPAVHVSFSIVHPKMWEVQRPDGVFQALVGFRLSGLMPWTVGLKPDTGSNLS